MVDAFWFYGYLVFAVIIFCFFIIEGDRDPDLKEAQAQVGEVTFILGCLFMSFFWPILLTLAIYRTITRQK